MRFFKHMDGLFLDGKMGYFCGYDYAEKKLYCFSGDGTIEVLDKSKPMAMFGEPSFETYMDNNFHRGYWVEIVPTEIK